jgi:translation initiation factor IF-3
VCRVLDYSKYKYEQAQKIKQAKKHQQQITVREIKFRPKIAQHDYDTKKHHVERFLRHKDKVKVTIMFRGREVTHPERGTAILDRLAEELSELGVVEQRPMQEGRNMTMMMAPSKAVLAGKADAALAADEVFADGGHVGDVASEALQSPLEADGVAAAEDSGSVAAAAAAGGSGAVEESGSAAEDDGAGDVENGGSDGVEAGGSAVENDGSAAADSAVS